MQTVQGLHPGGLQEGRQAGIQLKEMYQVFLYRFSVEIEGRLFFGELPTTTKENAEWAVRSFGGKLLDEEPRKAPLPSAEKKK